MKDRRLTPSNGRVAAAHLKGLVKSESFVEAEAHRVGTVLADLCAEPKGARDRQLLLGETFMILELHDGYAFGYAEKDGYVGWIDPVAFVTSPPEAPTHRLSVARSYGKSTPGLKDMGRIIPLPFGVQVSVLDESHGWSRIAWSRGTTPRDVFVPSRHLAPINRLDSGPIKVASMFLGTPYLWGGNSAFGIDCSGLVQAACLACGIACPGDSDMQEAELGDHLPDDAPLSRGDLLFWKGHVAWVADPETLIHANANDMAVAYETIEHATKRIADQGEGPVTARKRLGGLS